MEKLRELVYSPSTDLEQLLEVWADQDEVVARDYMRPHLKRKIEVARAENSGNLEIDLLEAPTPGDMDLGLTGVEVSALEWDLRTDTDLSKVLVWGKGLTCAHQGIAHWMGVALQCAEPDAIPVLDENWMASKKPSQFREILQGFSELEFNAAEPGWEVRQGVECENGDIFAWWDGTFTQGRSLECSLVIIDDQWDNVETYLSWNTGTGRPSRFLGLPHGLITPHGVLIGPWDGFHSTAPA